MKYNRKKRHFILFDVALTILRQLKSIRNRRNRNNCRYRQFAVKTAFIVYTVFVGMYTTEIHKITSSVYHCR